MRALLLAVLLSSPASAATISGADYAGADLLPANGDTLSGTFTNVRLFSLPAGTTVFVAPGASLAVYASTVALHGMIDGAGRGEQGGAGGAAGGAGLGGFGAGPGGGGAAGKGGGGGSSGGAGGAGSGPGAGTGAAAYGAAAAETSPLSADDARAGSGGGGGGGSLAKPGGAGAAGGAAVYLEASSMTVTGTIAVSGSTAAAVTNNTLAPHPAAGGGGGGGTVALRVTGALDLAGARLYAAGGDGGNVATSFGGVIQPGGGGGGGRVKVFYAAAGNAFAAVVSTAPGAAGTHGGVGGGTPEAPANTAGAAGSAAFGRVAQPPSALAAQQVWSTSITWSWTAAPSFGDGTGAQTYRLYPSTVTAPFPGAEAQAASPATTLTVQSLTPNTTYSRFLTAFTDWGDSAPSAAVSTFTRAAAPALAAVPFTAAAEASVTFAYTAPTNPSYTLYEVQRATDSAFSSPAVSLSVGASSAPASLSSNTTYWFRARAVNLAGTRTEFTAAAATSTLAAAPAAAAAGPIHVTSGVFTWSGSGNPQGTEFVAQISTDNFFTLADSSRTLSASATFFSLSPGQQYFFRAYALNRQGLSSAYSAVISTTPGLLGTSAAPAAPGKPAADRRFSYDGAALFSWPAASSPVGILDYHLLVGSTPGGSDFFNGSTTTLAYQAAGLQTGRTYYARVRARSNAGVYSEFSDVSAGLPVFITTEVPTIPKPFNWPNPFDPADGPTQIGFYLETPADVTLKIYTLQGALIYQETRPFQGGNQVFPWAGRASSGLTAAPGGYVAMLEAGSKRQKLKIAVLY